MNKIQVKNALNTYSLGTESSGLPRGGVNKKCKFFFSIWTFHDFLNHLELL